MGAILVLLFLVAFVCGIVGGEIESIVAGWWSAKPAELVTVDGARVTCPVAFSVTGPALDARCGQLVIPRALVASIKRRCDFPCDEAVR